MMKNITCLMIVVMVLLLGCQQVSTQGMPTQENLGVLELYENSGFNCSIVIERGYANIKLGSGNDCTDDEIYTFSLKGLVPGVKIKFCGDDDCKRGGTPYSAWIYEIQTLKRDSSVDRYELDKLIGMPVGFIPHKSFKVIDSYDDGQVHGKLSRVQIRYCDAGDDRCD